MPPISRDDKSKESDRDETPSLPSLPGLFGANKALSPTPSAKTLGVHPSRTELVCAILGQDFGQLENLVGAGANLEWPGGGALQLSLQLQDSRIARYLLSKGASPTNACLDVASLFLFQKEPDFLTLLISAGVRVNSPAGDCPLLFSMCSIAMIQEKLIKDKVLDDDAAQRALNQRIIQSLLNAGAYSFEVLVSQNTWIRKVIGREYTEYIPRCSWLLDLLAPHKRQIRHEIQSNTKQLFLWPAPSSAQDTSSQGNLNLASQNTLRANFNWIPTIKLLSAYCGQKYARLDRIMSLADELLSRNPGNTDATTALLLYAAKHPSIASPILDLVISKNAAVTPWVLETLFLQGCERLDWKLIEKLLSLGVDPDTQTSRGVALSVHSDSRHDSFLPPRLLATKILVERGANVRQALAHLRLRGKTTSAPAVYLSTIEKVLDPKSPLFHNTLLPPNLQIYGCEQKHAQQRKSFKLLSHYAAAAVFLSASPPAFNRLSSEATQSLFQRLISECVAEIRTARLSISQAESDAQSALTSCIQYFHELVSAFRDTVIIPSLVSKIGPQAVAKTTQESVEKLRHQIFPASAEWLLGNISLREMHRLFARWAKIRSSHPRGNRQNSCWHPLLPETELAPGVTVRALCSYNELVREGEAMNNCLARGLGTTSCLLGDHHILSIRCNGSHLLNLTVTAEMGPDGAKTDRWRISEYEGKSNDREPGAELMRYLHIFERRLLADDLPISKGPFGQTQESLLALRDNLNTPIERVLGMDLGAPPIEAIEFYKVRLCCKPDKRRQTQPLLTAPIFKFPDIPAAFAPFLDSLRIPDCESKNDNLG